MEKKMILAILCLLTPLVVDAQITFGNHVKINDGWKFCLDSLSDFSAADIDDRRWRTVDLPHDWSIESCMSEDLYSCTGYLPGGIGWYRKTFTVPKSESDRKQYLYFCGVYCNSEVWINGHSLGKRPNGYVPFIYDITGHVRYGKENTIAVKVDHSRQADSRWYTGSGIYRDVYLVSSGYIHIDNWGVFARTSSLEDGVATLDVSVRIVNETDADEKLYIEHRLYRKGSSDIETSSTVVSGIMSGAVKEETVTLEVSDPELWSPESPALYRLETSIYDDEGNYLDGTTTVTGIRTTSFDPDRGFFLNGENMKMKGVCLHHDAGALGAAVPESVWRRRLMTLKDIGVNAVRMSHNLQDEVVYDLCDELGFLVKDEAFDEWEFPKRKWLEGWNVGKNPGFQGYAEYFNEWAVEDLKTMVERDKNHPSVVLWSIGNEVDYPNDPYSHPILDYEGINQKTLPGYKPEKPNAERIGLIAEKFVKVIKDIDTSRAVTGAMAGVVMSNHTRYPFVLDVTGYNYTENRYVSDHIKYPERVIYGSENRHEYQHWVAVRDNDHIFGQFLWTGIDYLGEAGRYPSRGFICGLTDLGGFMKPRGLYRKTLWSDEPVASLGTILKKNIGKKTLLFDLEPEWNYSAGDTVRVAAFTNCPDTVRLYLNGEPVTDTPMWDKSSNALYWDIAYRPGILRLETSSENGRTAEAVIRTYGKAFRITASADRQVMSPDGDVIHVEINVLDEHGTRVLDADDMVTCEVEGAGKLLRLENASPVYTGPYVTDTMPLYKGRMLAYVKSVSEGEIRVRVSSPSLGMSCSLVIHSVR